MIKRLFLIVEGKDKNYPQLKKNKVYLSKDDPAKYDNGHPILISPIFAIDKLGYKTIPKVTQISRISFMMIANPFPSIGFLKGTIDKLDNLWFSIGLANLIVFESQEGVINNIRGKLLSSSANIIAEEIWIIENGSVVDSSIYNYSFVDKENSVVKMIDSNFIPEYLKFVISEYTISVKKILEASRQYTPYYYKKFKEIFKRGNYLVATLCYLFGDNNYQPTPDVHDLIKNDQEFYDKEIDNIINEKHNRLIQLTSAITYVYNQIFSGAFPLFDHFGLIRRHSLLGIGGSVGALFEIVNQLEEVFIETPIDNKLMDFYENNCVPENYIYPLMENFSTRKWYSDDKMNIVKEKRTPKVYKETTQDFFCRFAFFSGRLGFREYDFSATAALQTLVSARTLQWNVINYTHEIIHNHVRIILNRILRIPNLESTQHYQSKYHLFIEKHRQAIYKNIKSLSTVNVKYNDYFLHLIILYCNNIRFWGSLSKEWNKKKWTEAFKIKNPSEEKYLLYDKDRIVRSIKKNYRDISEIFVHVFDFNYIYHKNVDFFVENLWRSWATVSSVTNDLKHYILRTLLVLASASKINLESSDTRFYTSIQDFYDILETMMQRNKNNIQVINNIMNLISDRADNKENLDDLRFRFSNCICIADLANAFLTADMFAYLSKGDKLSKKIKNRYYDLEHGEFPKSKTISKVRIAFDQLIQSIENTSKSNCDEYESAWLFLSLSSNYSNYD